jgi:hypothetical protein
MQFRWLLQGRQTTWFHLRTFSRRLVRQPQCPHQALERRSFFFEVVLERPYVLFAATWMTFW